MRLSELAAPVAIRSITFEPNWNELEALARVVTSKPTQSSDVDDIISVHVTLDSVNGSAKLVLDDDDSVVPRLFAESTPIVVVLKLGSPHAAVT